MPFLSVVMPAFNAASTLAEALSSLALQTFRDFEVIIVDDGSTDATRQVADGFAGSLALRVLTNPVNSGVAASLNRGIASSDSLFIARLDADDIAHPERFAQQLAFLDANPHVDVCGSDMPMFQTVAAGSFAVHRHPATDAGIKTMLLQHNALSHPSVLVRRSFFDTVGLYDPAFDFAEDYELWCRGALMGRSYANLPSPLTCYRVHPGQVGQTKRQLQFERDTQVKQLYMAGLLGDVPTAHLPHLLSPLARFESRDAAAKALVESASALLELGRRVPDPGVFADIVRACIQRHIV